MSDVKTRLDAEKLCRYVIDDALSARALGSDMHAVIRSGPPFRHKSAIVLCYCESGVIGVSVHSCLDVEMGMYESIDLAINFLLEIGEVIQTYKFFPGNNT